MMNSIAVLSTVIASVGHLVPIDEVFEPSGSYPTKKYGKVAVVQWAPPFPTRVGVTPTEGEHHKAGNRAALEGFVREAASNGAEMIVTSEFGIVGYPDFPELPPEEDEYRNPEDLAPYVETVPGPSTRFFGKLAKELGVYIQFGLAEAVSPNLSAPYYNTAVMMGPNGKMLAKYHKINLYSSESNFLHPGEEPATFETPFGKGGIVICADIYSSHPMDAYLEAGVDFLTLSTSWAQWNSGMKSFQSGARWAKAYVLAANQQYFPDSGVINPNGTTQSHIRQTNGIAYGYLPRRK